MTWSEIERDTETLPDACQDSHKACVRDGAGHNRSTSLGYKVQLHDNAPQCRHTPIQRSKVHHLAGSDSVAHSSTTATTAHEKVQKHIETYEQIH